MKFMKLIAVVAVLAIVALLLVGKKNSGNNQLVQPVAVQEDVAPMIDDSVLQVDVVQVATDTNTVSVVPLAEHNVGADDSAEAQANKLGLSFANAVRVSTK